MSCAENFTQSAKRKKMAETLPDAFSSLTDRWKYLQEAVYVCLPFQRDSNPPEKTASLIY